MLGLFLLLGIILHTISASYVAHPNINIDLLGISGTYDGISLYTDTSQLTQIPSSTSSVVSYSNDSIFQLLASSNINGIIHDTCILHNVVYFAGNFTSINSFSANHIASIDLSSGQFNPLHQGLDGPVNSVYCDPVTQFVYVGGSFLAPINSDSAYSASLAQFGGNVAIWNRTGWTNVPWKGVNGHINSIIRHNDNLLFGGVFDKTMDGQADYAPASSIIKLSSTGASGTNTLSSSSTPSSIVCSDTKNTSTWTLAAGKTGTWQTSFNYYSVNPSLIRIGNSKVPDYQTKQFGVRAIDGQSYYQMSYLDHSTNQTRLCTNDCTLSNDPSLESQDYRIMNTSLTFGIAIDVFSWYGSGGGLSSVSVFQSENFIYALDAEAQMSPCSSESHEPTVKTVGNWTKVTKDASSYLYSSSSQNSSITFYPTVAESGIYEVYLYTADCTEACANPVDVDIQISTSAGQTQTVFVGTQTKAATGILIYTGYFDITSGFKPSFQMMSAHNATSSGSIAAHSFQLVKESSVNELKSIIRYNPVVQVAQATSLSWGALTENLPLKSIVYDMKSYENDLYIAGSFKGVDEANSNYSNIVQLNGSTQKFKSLANAGTNGSIQSLVISSQAGEIFAAGKFTVEGKQIENIGRYSLKQMDWNPLDKGVNGSVQAVHLINERVLVSGEFSKLPNGSTVFGNGWWDVARQTWTLDNVPYLSGIIYSTLEYNKAVYFSGKVQGAQKYRSFGSSFITQSGLSQLPFYPTNDHPVVSAGAIYDNSTSILGGRFTLEKDIKNIAIYRDGIWSGVSGSDWEGTVHAMTVHHDILYVGGQFSGSGTSGFAGFDLKNRTLKIAPMVKGFDGDSASVNVVLSSSSDNQIIIGGNFSSIGNFSCPVVCMLGTADYQWTALGSGLSGEVTDIKFIDDKLVATGNMTLNKSPITIAEYDFSKKVWGPFATANLPGPSVALTHDNITKNTYISGQNAANDTTYLRVWNGQQFNPIDHGLGYGSVISKIYSIPVKHDATQNTLLATGFINLGKMGNVSAAFFDGKSWIPYLVTSSSTPLSSSSLGKSNALLSGLFYFDLPHVASVIKNYLSTSIVILVSIAISLGIVSIIVFITMAIILLKKRSQAKTDPQSDPSTYYGKAPRTAESLLAALKDNGDDTNNYSAEKLDTLEPEAHIYSMSKAISTDYLSDPSVRGTPLSPAPVHSIHQMNTNSFYNPTSPTLPISSARPVIFK
ncbi:cortical protein marker for cell polarity-domain-containing protein [Sporodiniella umbellata]|nr:cortical protein marker for cell polarity-domain-containing protein [Sporodiniella umbellata]